MSIYNPPEHKFLTTDNPVVRVLMSNKCNRIPSEKYEDIIADVICDVEYDFDSPDEQYIAELMKFVEPDDKKETTYPTSRFTVTEINEDVNDDNDDLVVFKEKIGKMEKMKDDKLEKIAHLLKIYEQLWNIIIPVYSTNSGTKCTIVDDEYYYNENDEYADITFDFMLRNGGLFLEVLPIYDDTETWRTITSKVPTQTLKTFGLSIIDLGNDYKEIIMNDMIKITLVNVDGKPENKTCGPWSCYKYDNTYKMKLVKNVHFQRPFMQIMMMEFEKYQTDKEFEESEWSTNIQFSKFDNFINAESDILRNKAKNNYATISNILKQKNIEGLTQIDIWTLFKEACYEAHIGKPNSSTQVNNWVNTVSTDEEPEMSIDEQLKNDMKYAKKLSKNFYTSYTPQCWEDVDPGNFDY